MKFQLHKIIDYAVKKSAEIEKAKKEFFNGGYVNDESTRELFIEWLIFDFKQASGVTFTAEYILKNPDNLPESTINGFRQIHETQVYSEFQISSVKPGNYLDLNDILTSKKYRVYDKLGSNNSQNKGLLRTRIAQVEGKWFIVGSNPIYIPIVYTPRMKKIIRKEKFLRVTIQDTAELLSKQSTTPSAPPKLLLKGA